VKKVFFALLLLLLSLAGCQKEKTENASSQIEKLKTQNSDLAVKLQQSQKESEQLKKQIQALRNFGENFKPEDIYNLQKINITRYTNLYDNDDDGKKETLLVYIQPMDEYGDVVKATGLVEVQLWDLDRKEGQSLLGQWRVSPAELKKLWFATLITVNYRLSFNIAALVEKFDHSLTVKVKFTDYLSGKTFEEQKVIKPQ
jgi:outer membrane murein-binding lipoprotein Lpp